MVPGPRQAEFQSEPRTDSESRQGVAAGAAFNSAGRARENG